MKKIIAIVLSAVLLVSALAVLGACKEKEADVLVMATNAAFPPYEYVEGGEFAGIDVEIAQLIAKELGMELQIEDVEFGSIVTGVKSGKYDMGMAGMTVTEDRLKNVNFSTSYAKGVQVIIVKEDSPYTAVEDFYNEDGTATLENVMIGVQQDTTGDIYASDTVENYGFGSEHVTQYLTGADAVQALVTDKVSAVIIDKEPAKAFVAANEGLKILETPFADEDYAICIAKENTELLEKINAALEKLIENGEVEKIVNKYINAD